MNKIFRYFFLTLLVSLSVLIFTACSEEKPTKGLLYTKIEDGYEVSKGTAKNRPL